MDLSDKSPISEILERTKQTWPEAHTPETRVMLGVIRLNDIVLESTNHVFARHGMTEAAFEVLVTLRSLSESRCLTPTELCRSTLLTSGGMTKVLKQLEKDGLIRRLDNTEDRRSRLVELTDAGSKRIEAAMADVSRNDRSLLSQVLSAKQIEELGDLILLTLDHLESKRPR